MYAYWGAVKKKIQLIAVPYINTHMKADLEKITPEHVIRYYSVTTHKAYKILIKSFYYSNIHMAIFFASTLPQKILFFKKNQYILIGCTCLSTLFHTYLFFCNTAHEFCP